MKEKLNNGYVKMGLTIIFSGVILILIYYLVKDHKAALEAVTKVREIFAPFLYGFVMAYLLCPVYNWSVRNTYRLSSHSFKVKRHALTFSRVIGTVVALLVLTAVVGGFLALVIPELLRSIFGLLQIMPDRMTELLAWVNETFDGQRYPEASKIVQDTLVKTRDALIKWTQEEFLPKIGIYMSQISQGVILTVMTIIHMLIGVIVCVYLLNGKEVFRAQARKLINATLNKEKSDAVLEFAYFTNRTFGGFISGKLIDSIIMGILCFIVMSMLHLPYVMLVSTIVGITNFIPFFGPFIGAIPSAIIICFVSPVQALYFLIMILVLQQIDGNIIGPKILGETTGLASFWVMFTIIVAGGLFGFAGMILGVPVFSLIYYYFKKAMEKRLERKQKPVETKEYQDFNAYNINREDVQ